MRQQLITAWLLLSVPFTIHAQYEGKIEGLLSAWSNQKKALIQIEMALTDRDSLRFWPLYEAYEDERVKLERERLFIIREYSTHCEEMTERNADDIIKRFLRNNAAFLDMREYYYAKTRKATNALKAALFDQMEVYLQAIIRAELKSGLSFVTMGTDRRNAISNSMHLTSADSARFWPIYDRYEKDRKKLVRERASIVADFVRRNNGFTNSKANKLMLSIFKNDESFHKLQKQYHGKIKANLNGLTAARFIQLENYLQNAEWKKETEELL